MYNNNHYNNIIQQRIWSHNNISSQNAVSYNNKYDNNDHRLWHLATVNTLQI